MKNLRTVTAVSDMNIASNENTYVNLTFAACIEDGILLPQEVRAFFCDEELAKSIKPGLKLDVQPY